MTGILNVFEFTHHLEKRGRRDLAGTVFASLASVTQGLTARRILAGAELRVRYPERGFSYADAGGYATARELGATFVTTDRSFRGLPSVEIIGAPEG